jgi:hypothetical protein
MEKEGKDKKNTYNFTINKVSYSVMNRHEKLRK